MNARHRPRGRSDTGAAAVEMAIVLPLLLLLVFGIIDFGRMLNAQLTLSAAAREGARWAALGQTGVAARVALAAPALTPAPSAAVTPCPASPAIGTNATVTVTYTFTFVTPLSAVGGLFGGGGVGPATKILTGQGVMRCGG
jgi:Flp pilus assembly protein TadG